ncbi:MAG: hypothetical protein JWQ70_299 [Aeromicrobium sp.]|nr:hypothetical protein [Aeromicrobium sp.]
MKLRFLTALAVLVSALVHLKLWKDVFRHTDTVGPAMLLNFFGGVVIAVLLISWKHWIPLLLAVAFGVATLGSFIIATTSGLYGVHEKWTGWEVFTAAAVEIIAIIVGGALLLRERPKQTSRV